MINRQCQDCGGYELDDGTSELCYCYEIIECKNGCGETVYLGEFCSTKCKLEFEEPAATDNGKGGESE